MIKTVLIVTIHLIYFLLKSYSKTKINYFKQNVAIMILLNVFYYHFLELFQFYEV